MNVRVPPRGSGLWKRPGLASDVDAVVSEFAYIAAGIKGKIGGSSNWMFASVFVCLRPFASVCVCLRQSRGSER